MMVSHGAVRAGYLYSAAGLRLDEELAQAKHAKEQRFRFSAPHVADSNEGYLAMLAAEPWWRRRPAQRTPLEAAQCSLCLGVAATGRGGSCSHGSSLAELPRQILAQISQILRTSLCDFDAQLRTAFEADDSATVQRLMHVIDQADENAAITLEAQNLCVNAQLREAAAEGNVQVVDRLLRRGAVPDATDADGTTALHLAAEFHRVAVIGALLSAGADVDATDGSGGTPLLAAVLTCQSCRCAAGAAEQSIRLLVSARADINVADDEGLQPLAVAKAEYMTHVRVLSGHDWPVSEQEQATDARERCSVSQNAESTDLDICDPSPTQVRHDIGASSKATPIIDAVSASSGGGWGGSMVTESRKWWIWEMCEQTVRDWTAYYRTS